MDIFLLANEETRKNNTEVNVVEMFGVPLKRRDEGGFRLTTKKCILKPSAS